MAVHETIFFKAFQFTPLREGRHDAHRRGLVGTISIHAPPRGATGLPICAVMALSFQFTPLREGRLNGALTSATVSTISIHAPPRGATSPLRTCSAQKNCISIHAPPRGATRVQSVLYYNHKISIHAPPRGATEPVAATRGGTPISIHAPPRGATRTDARKELMLGYFNSRPSARGDNRNDNGIAVCRISIHAPPRGATVRMLTLLAVTTFQFTPLREGRHPPRPEEPGGVKISIHAPPRGATLMRVRII